MLLRDGWWCPEHGSSCSAASGRDEQSRASPKGRASPIAEDGLRFVVMWYRFSTEESGLSKGLRASAPLYQNTRGAVTGIVVLPFMQGHPRWPLRRLSPRSLWKLLVPCTLGLFSQEDIFFFKRETKMPVISLLKKLM